VKLPSGLRVKEPYVGPVSRTALKGSPSGSLSFQRTPGTGTFKGVSCGVEYESSFAWAGWEGLQ